MRNQKKRARRLHLETERTLRLCNWDDENLVRERERDRQILEYHLLSLQESKDREREWGKGKEGKWENFGEVRGKQGEWGHASWKCHVARCHWLCAFLPGDPTCCHVTVNPVLSPRRIRILRLSLSLSNSLSSLFILFVSCPPPALFFSLYPRISYAPTCFCALIYPSSRHPLCIFNLMVFWSLEKIGMILSPSFCCCLCVFHSSVGGFLGGFQFLANFSWFMQMFNLIAVDCCAISLKFDLFWQCGNWVLDLLEWGGVAEMGLGLPLCIVILWCFDPLKRLVCFYLHLSTVVLCLFTHLFGGFLMGFLFWPFQLILVCSGVGCHANLSWLLWTVVLLVWMVFEI